MNFHKIIVLPEKKYMILFPENHFFLFYLWACQDGRWPRLVTIAIMRNEMLIFLSITSPWQWIYYLFKLFRVLNYKDAQLRFNAVSSLYTNITTKYVCKHHRYILWSVYQISKAIFQSLLLVKSNNRKQNQIVLNLAIKMTRSYICGSKKASDLSQRRLVRPHTSRRP